MSGHEVVELFEADLAVGVDMLYCVKYVEVPVCTDVAWEAIVEGKGVNLEVRDNVGSLVIDDSDGG